MLEGPSENSSIFLHLQSSLQDGRVKIRQTKQLEIKCIYHSNIVRDGNS